MNQFHLRIQIRNGHWDGCWKENHRIIGFFVHFHIQEQSSTQKQGGGSFYVAFTLLFGIRRTENYSSTLCVIASKEKPCQLCSSVPDFAAHKGSKLNRSEYCIEHFHSNERGELGVLISNSNVWLRISKNSNCLRNSSANSDNPGPTVWQLLINKYANL